MVFSLKYEIPHGVHNSSEEVLGYVLNANFDIKSHGKPILTSTTSFHFQILNLCYEMSSGRDVKFLINPF